MISRIALCSLSLLTLPVCAQQEKVERIVRLPTGFATEMVLVPDGSFPRGMEGEAFDEQPVRQIYLDAYLIDKYEVTVAQFAAFVEETVYPFTSLVFVNGVQFAVSLRQQHIPHLVVEMEIEKRTVHVENGNVDGVPIRAGERRGLHSKISPNF